METSLEEGFLQRIFDLKQEVVVELESHETKFREALLSNLFLKGIDPPSWLLPSDAVIPPSGFCSDGHRIHLQDSVNRIRDQSKQHQFSELFGGFYSSKRDSSSVDRPAYHHIPDKRRRLEKSVPSCFVEESELEGFEDFEKGGEKLDGEEPLVAAQLNGNQGKGHFVDATRDRNGGKQDFAVALVDRNGVEHGLVDAHMDRNEGNLNLVDAQMHRNEDQRHLAHAHMEKDGEEEDWAGAHVDKCELDKGSENVPNGDGDGQAKGEGGGRGRGRGRGKGRGRARGGAKEMKTNDSVPRSPFVGRITRSRAKQCQIVLSAKSIGKRKAMAASQHSQVTRNKRVKLNLEPEVLEEPNNVTIRSSPEVRSQIRDNLEVYTKSSPVTSEPRVENRPSPTIATLQNEGKSSLQISPSPIQAKSSPAETLFQTEHRSALVVMAQLEVKDDEVEPQKLELTCDVISNLDYKSAQQEETSSKVKECATGQTNTCPDCRGSTEACGLKDILQTETLDATETAQQEETLNTVENRQHYEKSDATEGAQMNRVEETHPMGFQSQLQDKNAERKDNLKLVEECIGGWQTSEPDCRSSYHFNLKDDQQSEVTDVLKIVHLQETANALGHAKQHVISDIGESVQINGRGEMHPMNLESHIQDNLPSVEKDFKEVPAILSPLENQRNLPIMNVDSSAVRNSDALPQMVASHCRLPFCGKAELVIEDTADTTQLFQETSSNSQSCYSGGKSHLSYACQPSTGAYPLSERLVSSDKKVHQVSCNANLSCKRLSQEIRDIELKSHKFSPENDASDRTVMKVWLRNEMEETNATGANLETISRCPNGTEANQDMTQKRLHIKGNKYGKEYSTTNVDILQGRPASFDSALRIICHELQKSDDSVTLDPAKKLRSRSIDLDRCKDILGKVMTGDSKLIACKKQTHDVVIDVEENDYKKQISFSRSERLSKQSPMLSSQGNGGHNHVSSKEDSSIVEAGTDEFMCQNHIKTSIRDDLFEKTSIPSPSFFNKDPGMQVGEMKPKRDPPGTAVHASFQGIASQPQEAILYAKAIFVEHSSCSEIEPAQNDQAQIVNTSCDGMVEGRECGLIPERGKRASSMDVNVKVLSENEEDMVSHIEEVTEFAAKKMDEPSIHLLKSGDIPGNMGASDSTLTSFCQDEAAREHNDTMCDAPANTTGVHASLDAVIDLTNEVPSKRGKLFSRNMFPQQEEGGLKLQHKSWPEYQKQRGHLQEEFHSTGQRGLLQSGFCSKAFLYENSVLAAIPNSGRLISQFDQVVTPCPSNSKRYFNKENGEQKHAVVVNTPSLNNFSCPKGGSLEAFLDKESASLLPCQIKKTVEQSPGDSKRWQMARLILEDGLKSKESSTMGLYQRLSCLTDSAEVQRQIGNINVGTTSPLCISYSKTKEGSLSSTGLPLVEVDAMYSQVTSNSTSLPCSLYKGHLPDSLSNISQSFRSSFEVTSPPDRVAQGGYKFLHSDDTISEFSFQNRLGAMEKCDMKNTPLMKRSVTGERDQCGLSNSLAKNPSNQFKSAAQGSQQDFTGEVDVRISELAPRKKNPSLEADCQLEVNIANVELAKGVAEIQGIQHLKQKHNSFTSTEQTLDSVGCESLSQSTTLGSLHNVKIFQGLEGLNHRFSSKDRSFSSGKMDIKAEKHIEHKAIRCSKSSFVKDTKATELYNAFGSLTPAPNHMSKCRIRTPSDVCWPCLSMEPQQYSVSSNKYRGKRYASNDSSADKPQTNSGSKDTVEYGSKIKNSCSLTPAAGTLFNRAVTNSMETDSNFPSKQVQMKIEHAGCFPIEEESGVEEESMGLHAMMNVSGKQYGSPTEKSVWGTKNVLMDCTSARQNSPLTTPAGERLFEKISRDSMDIGSDLFSKQASISKVYINSSNLEEEVCGKENRDPCVQVNELQKKHGSSVKKKVSRNPNIRADSIFASQFTPRSNQKPGNILCNVKSFIPLVQQKQAASSIMTGKRDIKVKALEAAEAAKRLEEKREQERKMRKELARRGEHEKNVHEKSKEERCKGEKEGEETSRATSDCSTKSISSVMPRKKLVGCALQKSHLENSSQLDSSAYGVDLKLKRVLEAKTKMEQEKLRKLEEEQKRKEEERKKKDAEVAAKKRKREEMERKDREEKRKRLELAQKQQKETEEQLRAEKEIKEQRRRALDDYERKRKAVEEEAKKQRRIEKEKEAAERRRRLEEDAKASKYTLKDAKHLDEVHQHHETTLQAQRANVGKVSSMSNSCAQSGQPETEGQPMLGSIENSLQSVNPQINIDSYEISPYKGSDEDDDDDVAPGKFVPLWARKENLIAHLISQQHIDPDKIFTGAKTCSLNEVFGTDGSLKRRDFSRRSRSGEWLNDKFTWKEEYQYKLQMGYINKG